MRTAAVVLCLLVGGCATQSQQPPVRMVWARADLQRITGSPALEQQMQLDTAVCDGEVQKANLSGTQLCRGLLDCAVASSIRGSNLQVVAKGCMAQRGYALLPEDEAERRLAEAEAAKAPPAAKLQKRK